MVSLLPCSAQRQGRGMAGWRDLRRKEGSGPVLRRCHHRDKSHERASKLKGNVGSLKGNVGSLMQQLGASGTQQRSCSKPPATRTLPQEAPAPGPSRARGACHRRRGCPAPLYLLVCLPSGWELSRRREQRSPLQPALHTPTLSSPASASYLDDGRGLPACRPGTCLA
jgi:hypothetical protein